MDAILQFLIDWGYWGLFTSSFIAGSVLPSVRSRIGSLCRSVGLRPGDQYNRRHRRQCCRRHDLLLDGTSGQYGMDREIFSCKKEKMDRAERFVHGRGAGWLSSPLSLFWEVHIHCIGHDACQYMDCHSGHDNRKGTSICIVGLGSAGSLPL